MHFQLPQARPRLPTPLLVALSLAGASGCGGRTPVDLGEPLDAAVGDAGQEACNGRDDDGDGRVDESFRGARGQYLSDAHCGGCGLACDSELPNAAGSRCELIDDVATCVARECADGFGRSRSGGCVPLDQRLCLPCVDAADCGSLSSAQCVPINGQGFCLIGCGDGCPAGYRCNGVDRCEPRGGSCICAAGGGGFDLACSLDIEGTCIGRARCELGALLACEVPPERCDAEDNDCDGLIDEGFVDARGIYDTAEHCGVCGRDCNTDDDDAGVELTCGGDPFAPTCITFCPDATDGTDVGDALDADRRIENGCECRVTAPVDSPGAPPLEGQLDADCDGADGTILSSLYVANDGDDSDPGSPARPLATIGEAVRRAADSLTSGRPQAHVFVASGVYTETVRLRDGVQLHGGYRRDFLARSPDGFEVVVLAPADTVAPGGAALWAADVGARPTVVEGFTFRGRDADQPGGAAFGVVVTRPGGRLELRDLVVRSGKPGAGVNGVEGVAGASPTMAAGDGEPQRAAIENASHVCINGDDNLVRGGRGGQSRCDGVDVSGGAGGNAICPIYNQPTAPGQRGRGTGLSPGGSGGGGSANLVGPLGNDGSCTGSVCCGLADFRVPNPFPQPQAGGSGADGSPGTAGAGCADPVGSLDEGRWQAGVASVGSAGGPGGGGGGGGSGGGVEFTWFADECEWPDGLAGAGGGGGAAGCGGQPGTAGQSGGPAVALVVQLADGAPLPSMAELTLVTEDGARGGDGGSGGDGGTGGSGGFGGRLPDEQRTTPPVAGPLPGERGGKGGNGGAGGGAGGGCGGASFGAWITGASVGSAERDALRAAASFLVGSGGSGGRGGGGAVPGGAGMDGSAGDVLVR